MPSHSVGPGIWLSVWRFLLTHCLYERAAKVLARLRGCDKYQSRGPHIYWHEHYSSYLEVIILTKFVEFWFYRGSQYQTLGWKLQKWEIEHLGFSFKDVTYVMTDLANIACCILKALSNLVSCGLWHFTTVSRMPQVTCEPPHDKTNKMACALSEDSDQPGHLPSLMIRRGGGSTGWSEYSLSAVILSWGGSRKSWWKLCHCGSAHWSWNQLTVLRGSAGEKLFDIGHKACCIIIHNVQVGLAS